MTGMDVDRQLASKGQQQQIDGEQQTSADLNGDQVKVEAEPPGDNEDEASDASSEHTDGSFSDDQSLSEQSTPDLRSKASGDEHDVIAVEVDGRLAMSPPCTDEPNDINNKSGERCDSKSSQESPEFSEDGSMSENRGCAPDLASVKEDAKDEQTNEASDQMKNPLNLNLRTYGGTRNVVVAYSSDSEDDSDRRQLAARNTANNAAQLRLQDQDVLNGSCSVTDYSRMAANLAATATSATSGKFDTFNGQLPLLTAAGGGGQDGGKKVYNTAEKGTVGNLAHGGNQDDCCSGAGMSKIIVNQSERFFQWYGRLLATYPVKSILICLLIPSLCAIGLIRYHTENNPYKLWVPQDSDYIRNQDWLIKNFPEDLRFNSVILTAENILKPEYIKQLLTIHKEVSATVSSHGKSWEDVCYKLPKVDTSELQFLIEDALYDYDDEEYSDESDAASDTDAPDAVEDDLKEGDMTNTTKVVAMKKQKREACHRFKRSVDLGFNPSVALYPTDYCTIISDFTTYQCFENSLLEIWAKDNYGEKTEEIIANLTVEDILTAVNTVNVSAVFDREMDVTTYMGGIERNATGHIVGAKATFIRFFGQVNKTAISYNGEAALSKGAPVDAFTLAWEGELIETLEKLRIRFQGSTELVYNVARSFSDLSAQAIEGDAAVFAVGTGIVFVYVQVMLGKFSLVEQRPGLSAVGLGCYGLALLTSYGFCSGVGLVFSPLHAIIPFLLMGVGIDDMFVITQCLDNLQLKPEVQGLGTVELMGLTMKNAGMAITLTSLTNFLVFAIGACTALPALQSFCLYCAVGIASVYIYQATIFAAALSLDIRRVKQKRNGCMPFIKHPNWVKRESWSERVGKMVTEKVVNGIVHPVVSCFTVIITFCIFGVGVWGLTELKQEFNPVKFIPQESYLSGWFAANAEYFPSQGERVTVNIADIDYTTELPKLAELTKRLQNETDILSSVDSWYSGLHDYAVKNQLANETDWFAHFNQDSNKFYEILTQFLFSPDGAKYRRSFNFVNDLICGKAAPKVLLSSIELTHKLFTSPKEWIPAMNRIKKIVAEANFSTRAFPTGTEYASWETDEVIGRELYQNLGLSMICVLICTFILIASIRGCFIIFICVLITIVDVGGLMHFWGLTIDVISCVNLVIAVGLCVDYAAHVVHAFLLQTGSRRERTVKALEDIGPAVLNGGFSTFLAFILTAGSTSHVFASFFKIFFLVVILGLFHALFFLPVVLVLAGPDSHHEESTITVNTVDKGIANTGFTSTDLEAGVEVTRRSPTTNFSHAKNC